jgi:uncharacterized NAD(P)/FAD-binding protein YdhS
MQYSFDIAIIGGGAAAALSAMQLASQARQPLRIAVIDPAPALGQGVAYATTRPEHLLNVPAGKMSAWPDRPDDFLVWLRSQPAGPGAGDPQLAHRFMPRRCYPHYLRQRLDQALSRSGSRLEHIRARAVQLHGTDGQWSLQLDPGHRVQAPRILLATGNAPRPLPARGATGLAAPALLQAWAYEQVAAVPANADVAIIGTGLSMVDALMSLHAGGHRGTIHLLSRHALLPLAHAHAHQADAGLDVQALLALGLRSRLRQVRLRARQVQASGQAWQAVLEALRPHVRALWQSLGSADQRRFLRHLVRYWDIHRHRIAPEVASRLAALVASGQLHLHRARLDLVVAGPRCVRLSTRGHDGHERILDVDHLVNATGMEMRVQAMRNPLLEHLLGQGHARPGRHGIGLDSDGCGRLLDARGNACDSLRVIGSLRVGQEWESIAIPDLRQQAAVLAADWSA